MQVVKALATAQLEAKRIADEAQEDAKVPGAQDFDLQIENMSKVRGFSPALCSWGALSGNMLRAHSCAHVLRSLDKARGNTVTKGEVARIKAAPSKLWAADCS